MSTNTITPVDIDVGRRISQRRREVRMSQVALAENLGISFQQVQKYERGTNRVGAGRLSHIAEILSVPITFFFQDIPNQAETAATINENISKLSAGPSNEQETQLLKAFRDISDNEVKKQLLSMVKQIASSHK